MADYILVKGTHFIRGEDGSNVELKIGEKTNLTDEQAKAFGDKFKSMEVVRAELAAAKILAEGEDAKARAIAEAEAKVKADNEAAAKAKEAEATKPKA